VAAIAYVLNVGWLQLLLMF